MSADFPLKSDLPLADQLEIDRIQAIDEDKQTAQEQAFLDARQEYLNNTVLSFSMKKGIRAPQALKATAIITFTDDVSEGGNSNNRW